MELWPDKVAKMAIFNGPIFACLTLRPIFTFNLKYHCGAAVAVAVAAPRASRQRARQRLANFCLTDDARLKCVSIERAGQ